MYLLIDLSAQDQIHLAIFDTEHRHDLSVSGRNRELLTVIDGYLKEQAVQPASIDGIMVVVGAGGFSSTRIATTVANTFGYIYQIPLLAIDAKDVEQIQSLIPTLLAQPAGQYISATYSAEPNIRL